MRREISPNPPRLSEHHVRLPDQVADLLNASPLHARGLTGKGLRVAIIDSGFFVHPFYKERGYRILHVPTRKERNPEVDEYGHGTAQLASLFSLSPDVEALAIKCMDRDPSYALKKALLLKPDVISCAWGFNIDHPESPTLPSEYQKMRRLILKAIDNGISVVAAGGNGQRSFPGSMPEVIAAGGVYYTPKGSFEPSDVSSRFESSLFPGRVVPDVCGLVGNRPHGRLLLVPVPPRAKLARRPSFATIAAGGSSDVRRGWAMFSGTSAATAMVSGACALLMQAKPGIKPALIQRALIEGARIVPSTEPGEPADRLMDVAGALRFISESENPRSRICD